MRDENTENANSTKSAQYKTLIIIVLGGVFILFAIYFLTSGNSNHKKTDQKLETTSFVSPIDNVNTQSIWVERAQNQLKDQQQKTEELKQTIIQLKDDMQKSSENDPKFQAITEENELLKKSLEDKSQTPQVNQAMAGGSQYKGNVFSPSVGGTPDSQMPLGADFTGIDNDELQLTKSSTIIHKKNPDTYVPSGTFAKGVMLGAADASAGVNGQANPSPILVRIIADGTLPNHQKSHLKNCVLTVAVVGDISSERGQARTERMSCVFPDGEIVEQPVEGTIFGMDAKNGVRGHPVWREGALLGRAAVAGTLSGIGSGISQGYSTNSISPLGNTQTVNNGEIFKYGAAQGASNAMDKLADYNIRRAEQYHPIIQLTAGQPVDIVFLKGFFLDGQKHEDAENQNNNEPELFPSPANANTPSTGLTLSEQEMEKIKQHESQMGWVHAQQSGDR